VLTQQSALQSVHLLSNDKGDIKKKVTSAKHKPAGGSAMPGGLMMMMIIIIIIIIITIIITDICNTKYAAYFWSSNDNAGLLLIFVLRRHCHAHSLLAPSSDESQFFD